MSSIKVTAMGIDPGFAKCGIGCLHRMDDGRLVPGGVRLIKTAPSKGKQFQRWRQSMDDERRMHEYYDGFCAAIEAVKPKVLGVEVYTVFDNEDVRPQVRKFLSLFSIKPGGGVPQILQEPGNLVKAFASVEFLGKFVKGLVELSKACEIRSFSQRGRGAAAKTLMVYAAACCAGYRYGIPVIGFMPVDLKKGVCGKSSATKDEVAEALKLKIPGLEAQVLEKVRAKTMWEHVYDGVGHGYLALKEYEKWTSELKPPPPPTQGLLPGFPETGQG